MMNWVQNVGIGGKKVLAGRLNYLKKQDMQNWRKKVGRLGLSERSEIAGRAGKSGKAGRAGRVRRPENE